jgi:hypothetical protein
MKKITMVLCLVVSIILISSWLGQSVIQANENDSSELSEVKLTEEQKAELDVLYLDLITKRKEIINKYVEYGVMTKEKANQKNQHMDDFYNKLKEDDYIPKWDHKHGHHHKKES